MRLTSLIGTALFLLPLAALLEYSSGCGDISATCNCPNKAIPQALVTLPCGTTTLPTMSLSGVCAGTETTENGQLAFGSYEPGTCTVTLTFADGQTYTTNVEFTGTPLACGSNPTGCGELVEPNLPQNLGTFPGYTLAVGAACEDGGSDAAADAH